MFGQMTSSRFMVSTARIKAKAKEKAKQHQQHARIFVQALVATFRRTLSVAWSKNGNQKNVLAKCVLAKECMLVCSTSFARNHVENAKITRDTLL